MVGLHCDQVRWAASNTITIEDADVGREIELVRKLYQSIPQSAVLCESGLNS
ncbi:hypothetical protein QQP08_017884 [Theobroma cacao]|nr:hypothetical protein QQP08_017884 [Theobroma cacao]